jgi:hypothetical protein
MEMRRVDSTRLSSLRVIAKFVPERVDLRGNYVEAEPEGRVEIDVTREIGLMGRTKSLAIQDGTESSDALRQAELAPLWIRCWQGPFRIEVEDRIADFWAQADELGADEAQVRLACRPQECFVFDINRRVYPEDSGPTAGPVWREHWKAIAVSGETGRSWVLANGQRVPKGGDQRRGLLDSRAALDRAIWAHEQRSKVVAAVASADFDALYRVASELRVETALAAAADPGMG